MSRRQQRFVRLDKKFDGGNVGLTCSFAFLFFIATICSLKTLHSSLIRLFVFHSFLASIIAACLCSNSLCRASSFKRSLQILVGMSFALSSLFQFFSCCFPSLSFFRSLHLFSSLSLFTASIYHLRSPEVNSRPSHIHGHQTTCFSHSLRSASRKAGSRFDNEISGLV